MRDRRRCVERGITILNGTKSSSSQPSPSEFGIALRELDSQACVIAIEGELDLSTAPRLKWMLLEALEAGHSQLVVDLSLASFMDSTALGVLVGINRSLDVGVRLAIVCTQASVLRIFELSGMDGVFAIFPTLEQALVHARGESAQTG
jgi:anti-sigma B factor antagonist